MPHLRLDHFAEEPPQPPIELIESFEPIIEPTASRRLAIGVRAAVAVAIIAERTLRRDAVGFEMCDSNDQLCHFEDSQQPRTAQHTDAKWFHDAGFNADNLEN